MSAAGQRVIDCEQARLDTLVLSPAKMSGREQERLGVVMGREATAAELLRRPEIDYATLARLETVQKTGDRRIFDDEGEVFDDFGEQIALAMDVRAKYAGYIERQQREIRQQAKQASLRLPSDLDYGQVTGLSNEARQRLASARPVTLGQASRREGMTPSAVSLILIHLKKRQLKKSA